MMNIQNNLKNNVDIYIDSGKSEIGVPSTIIQVIDEKINTDDEYVDYNEVEDDFSNKMDNDIKQKHVQDIQKH